MKSETTRKYILKYRRYTFLSIITGFLPVIIYFCAAFFQSDSITKITLVTLLMIVILLSILNMFMKFHLRTPVFIFLIGIYIGLDHILGVLILISICTAADELIFSPNAAKYKSLATINSEIDKRG